MSATINISTLDPVGEFFRAVLHTFFNRPAELILFLEKKLVFVSALLRDENVVRQVRQIVTPGVTSCGGLPRVYVHDCALESVRASSFI